jgi:hypothetical protein
MNNLKIFEGLAYGSLIIGLISDFLATPSTGVRVAVVIITLLAAALVWAAARRGQAWAAWIFLIVFVPFSIIAILGGVGGPAWQPEIFRSDVPATRLEAALEIISFLLMVAAFYFYFFGGRTSVAGLDRR